MLKKSVKIRLADELEARPIAMLVQVASQYESTVYLEAGAKKVNAKSIMGMMSLGINNGDEVTIICEGSDENKAAEDVEKFLTSQNS